MEQQFWLQRKKLNTLTCYIASNITGLRATNSCVAGGEGGTFCFMWVNHRALPQQQHTAYIYVFMQKPTECTRAK